MNDRFALREAIGGVGVRRTVAQKIGVDGQIGVKMGVAPQELVGIILRARRPAKKKHGAERGGGRPFGSCS
ncbi:MAG: hypothetical protein Kow00133_07130 [Amphiplicatus sp.]